MIGKVRIRLKKIKPVQTTRPFAVHKLKVEKVADDLYVEIKNRFALLQLSENNG